LKIFVFGKPLMALNNKISIFISLQVFVDFLQG
jgi:hypothetical protein